MVFEVMVIEVIRISGVITNAGVIRIRLPFRNGFIRLASEWSGGSAAIAGTSITELPLRNQTRTSMEDTFDN